MTEIEDNAKALDNEKLSSDNTPNNDERLDGNEKNSKINGVFNIKDIVEDSFIKDYSKYKEYLEINGWTRENINIHEYMSTIVTINKLKADNLGTVIDIRCPPGHIMSIIGKNALSEINHPFEVKLSNSKGEEIGPNTGTRIYKYNFLKRITEIYSLLYKDVSMLNYSNSPNMFKRYQESYRFDQGIELKGEDHLKISVINPDIDIDIVKFNLGTDLWRQYDNEYMLDSRGHLKLNQKMNISEMNHDNYIKYLRNRGYNREHINIDETYTEIVSTYSLAQGLIGNVIDIRCPSRYKIFIVGRKQLKEKLENKKTNISVNLTNSENVEIAPDTRIKILKEKVSQTIELIDTIFYKDITSTDYMKNHSDKIKNYDDLYILDKGVELNGGDHLKIDVINPDIPIDNKNVKFSFGMDLWEQE